MSHIPYADIPTDARVILDELYLPEGSEIWWNAPNRLLGSRRPRDCPEDAKALADALADGVFF